MSHGLEQYQVSYYSDAELFLDYFAKTVAKVWVLDCSIRERMPRVCEEPILWMSNTLDEPDTIFKYRSASILLQTILHYVGKGTTQVECGCHTQLISFYTPIKRSLQTSFAMTAAHILSQKGRTLYLNLEGYSGFSQLLSGYYSKDISDFIYSIYHSKENFPLNTTNFIYRLGAVDVIPPVLNPINLREISRDMWLHMLTQLQRSGLYEYIILDLSDFMEGIFDILKYSQFVFSLSKSDEKAEEKWRQYRLLLEGLGLEKLWEDTHKVVVPHQLGMPMNLEAYEPGNFTDYVAKILGEVGAL